jgi:hypothetical protein
MMDPISALSFAVNILDLVDKAIKGVKTVIEVYNSANGLNDLHETLDHGANNLKDVVQYLQDRQTQTQYDKSEDIIRQISKTILSQCHELRSLLDECRRKKAGSLASATLTTFKMWRKSQKIEEIQQRIVSSRAELFNWIVLSTRYVFVY